MTTIFIMVDGVGLAPVGPNNPVPRSMPRTCEALGVPLATDTRSDPSSPICHPIDATLGVAGLPQSGTGHTAIYGGYNAAALNGRHQPSYPTVAMREQLAGHNLFTAALVAGQRVAWANAYLPGYLDAVVQRRLRHTAGTWSALQAGLSLRGLPELQAGTAVAWDVDQQLARGRPGCAHLPVISPEAAGGRLVDLAAVYDLVAFETYLPDLAGHGRIPHTPSEALRLVDGLIAGVLAALPSYASLIVTSDHGNVEDATTRVHTCNPVPLIAYGPVSSAFTAVHAIDGIMPQILATL